jgi:hypothetical protein
MSTRILPLAAILLAGSAAAGPIWTAVAAQPSPINHFVGNTVAWVCSDTACSSVSDTTQGVAMAECKAVARQVGKLTSFSTSKGPFSDSRLADCNEVARASAAKAP